MRKKTKRGEKCHQYEMVCKCDRETKREVEVEGNEEEEKRKTDGEKGHGVCLCVAEVNKHRSLQPKLPVG